MTQYKDSRGRSVSAEEIARAWIASHQDEAAALIRGRRAPVEPRAFQIHAKAAGDGKVQIERANPDDAA